MFCPDVSAGHFQKLFQVLYYIVTCFSTLYIQKFVYIVCNVFQLEQLLVYETLISQSHTHDNEYLHFTQAYNDDVCVGAIVCKLEMRHCTIKRGYIAMLAVDKNNRRKGIGK